MENWGGVFFEKSGPFLNAGCIMYSISIFYYTFYLFGGGVRTHPTHPPAYGPRSTQPCIPPGSLNRVPASAGVTAGMSPLPGGK